MSVTIPTDLESNEVITSNIIQNVLTTLKTNGQTRMLKPYLDPFVEFANSSTNQVMIRELINVMSNSRYHVVDGNTLQSMIPIVMCNYISGYTLQLQRELQTRIVNVLDSSPQDIKDREIEYNNEYQKEIEKEIAKKDKPFYYDDDDDDSSVNWKSYYDIQEIKIKEVISSDIINKVKALQLYTVYTTYNELLNIHHARSLFINDDLTKTNLRKLTIPSDISPNSLFNNIANDNLIPCVIKLIEDAVDILSNHTLDY